MKRRIPKHFRLSLTNINQLIENRPFFQTKKMVAHLNPNAITRVSEEVRVESIIRKLWNTKTNVKRRKTSVNFFIAKLFKRREGRIRIHAGLLKKAKIDVRINHGG